MNNKIWLVGLAILPIMAVSAFGEQTPNDFRVEDEGLFYGKFTVTRVGGADHVTITFRSAGIPLKIPRVGPLDKPKYCDGTKTAQVEVFALGVPAIPGPGSFFSTTTNGFGFIKFIVFDGQSSARISQIITQAGWFLQEPGTPPPAPRVFEPDPRKPSRTPPLIDSEDPATLLLEFKTGKEVHGGVFFDLPSIPGVAKGERIVALPLKEKFLTWLLDEKGTRFVSFKTFVRYACVDSGFESVAVVHWSIRISVQAAATQADSLGSASGSCSLFDPVPVEDSAELKEAQKKSGKAVAGVHHQKLFWVEVF